MDNIEKLQTSYDIGVKKAAKQYAYAKGSLVVAYSAVMVCGISLAVFLFKGAQAEVAALSYESLVSYFKTTNMLTGALYSFILPFLSAIVCFYSGFCIIANPLPVFMLLVNALYGGTLACVIYNGGNLLMCIAFCFPFLLMCLALSLFATEGTTFRKISKEHNKSISDILYHKNLFSYISLFATPLALLIASSMMSFVLPSLCARYI